MTEKIELNTGQEYSVQIYPTETVINARYAGENELEGFGNNHLFISEKYYILASNHWLRKKEDGTITYNQFSSAPIEAVSKKDSLDSRLSKFLETFGERIN